MQASSINNFQCKRNRVFVPCILHICHLFEFRQERWKKVPITQASAWIELNWMIKCCRFEVCAKYLMRNTRVEGKKRNRFPLGLKMTSSKPKRHSFFIAFGICGEISLRRLDDLIEVQCLFKIDILPFKWPRKAI